MDVPASLRLGEGGRKKVRGKRVEEETRANRSCLVLESASPGACASVLSYPCAVCNLQPPREESAQLEAGDGCVWSPSHGQKTASSLGSRASALQARSLACLVGETSAKPPGKDPWWYSGMVEYSATLLWSLAGWVLPPHVMRSWS